MAMDAQALAKKIHDALGQKADGHGKPTPVSHQTLNYAKGLVAALKAASFLHAPGTVVGVTAAGSPLSAGAAAGGIITIAPAPMIAETSKGVPPEAIPKSTKENTAIIAYLATATVTFAAGTITGTCTSTSEAPGILDQGAGTDGTLTGIAGPAAAAFVSAQLGGPMGPDVVKHYTAVIDYLVANCKGAYAAGSVVGVAPSASGPLSAGAGTGGTFA